MSTIEHQRYIGDGVYASYDPGHMIVLTTTRGSLAQQLAGNGARHWIALEPQVLAELISYACAVGWTAVVKRALERAAPRPDEHDD